MAGPRRFAEGTTVDVSRSQEQIKKLLGEHGCKQFMLAEGQTPDGRTIGIIQCFIYERMIKYQVEYPSAKPFVRDGRGHRLTSDQVHRRQEDEWKRKWRALQLIIKAKLEIVLSGDSTFEREFMADICLPDGGTVGDHMTDRIADAYATGTMPNLLGSGGG